MGIQGLGALAADDGAELLQTADDLPLSAVGCRPVVVDFYDFARRVLLCHNTIRVVVGIPIALRVPELGRAGIMTVA